MIYWDDVDLTFTQLVRRYGLTEPLTVQPGAAEDLDALWRQFTRGESHKRFVHSLVDMRGNETAAYKMIQNFVRRVSIRRILVRHFVTAETSLPP